MSTIKFGDTHTITLTVKDDAGVAVDLTGATILVLARPINGGAATELAATLGAATGTIEHTLTGTLAAGTYKVVAKDTTGSITTTSPTIGHATLTVEPNLVAPE